MAPTRFHGLAAALTGKGAPAGSPQNGDPPRNRCLFWGAGARRRCGGGAKRENGEVLPRALLRTVRLTPSSPSFHLLPPQPFFITSPHSCPSDSNAPTNLSVCGMPNLIRYYTFQQRQITTLLIRHPNPITSIGAFHRKTQFMKRRVRGDSTIRRIQTSKGAQGVRPTPKPFAPS